ncbi:hypothetical protein ACFVTF_06110 [Kitasatospora sp. NPDC057940]|uniref:hypothetical protein n=1 Tax=Kitasatospora sp. NPDC057940 TaxID=3346285 RepID=UPI0036D9891D
MTTSSTRRRRGRPGKPAFAPLPARQATGPAVPSAPRRPATACCRTWNSEHRLPGGEVVQRTWHQPACSAWAAR